MTRPSSPEATGEVAALLRQVEALQTELDEQARLYEESLQHIEQLEARHAEAEQSSAAMEQANVRVALLVEELENREQQFQEQADSLRRTKGELEQAHAELRRDQALREKYFAKVQSELETARTVQQLLIREPPADGAAGLDLATAYLPAGETGGDWLGFLHDKDRDELSILIGDVTGHGVGAALMTGGVFAAIAAADHLRSASKGTNASFAGLRGIARRNGEEGVVSYLNLLTEPRHLIELLDGVVAQMGTGRYLMTFFAASFQRPSRTLRYANAGHSLPFLLGKDEVASAKRYGARQIVARGNPMGSAIEHDTPREQHIMKLEAGDLLLFYTDGLLENRDRRKEAIGARKVLAWMKELYELPVPEIRDGLVKRVKDTLAGVELSDDISFVVARVRE
jgi:serine phosphatase RsbU (regulator of sigma subunit)